MRRRRPRRTRRGRPRETAAAHRPAPAVRPANRADRPHHGLQTHGIPGPADARADGNWRDARPVRGGADDPLPGDSAATARRPPAGLRHVEGYGTSRTASGEKPTCTLSPGRKGAGRGAPMAKRGPTGVASVYCTDVPSQAA